jgi:hypothetical protein
MKKPASPGGGENEEDNGVRMTRRLDPLVRALLGHLPQSHAVWPPQERQKWLQLLSEAFGVIYKDAPDKPGAGGGASTQHPPGSISTAGQR